LAALSPGVERILRIARVVLELIAISERTDTYPAAAAERGGKTGWSGGSDGACATRGV
jgi:hypothetical protein